MMYISVFPIAISVRRTNVYEEKSLGIYGSKGEEEEDEKEPSYIGAHLRRQLSFDLWFVFLGLFIIAIAEGARIQDPNDIAFNMFSKSINYRLPLFPTAKTHSAVLFEIVSAYGTVGLSLGYPTINASFSAEFSVVSKLVIIAMMIRGRHRGLPYELDRAILLPSESLHKKEDQDAAKRMPRRSSHASMAGALTSSTTEQRNEQRREQDGGQMREPGIGFQKAPSAHSHPHLHPSHGLGKMMATFASRPTFLASKKSVATL